MPSKSKAWKALWPAALVLTLLALLTAGWFWTKGQAEQIYAEQAALHDTRTALTCSQPTWSGYPFKLQLDCSDPIIHLNRGQTQLRPHKLTGYIRAPNLKTIHVRVDGPTSIRDANEKSQTTILHQPATVRVHAQSTALINSDTEMTAVEIQQTGTTIAEIGKARLQTKLNSDSVQDLHLTIKITDLHLHLLKADPITIADAQTTIQVHNAPREQAADAVEWMKAAANQGTTFKIKELQARYGSTHLLAQGGFKIEEAGTIDGSLETRVTNLDAFLRDLRQRQVLTPNKAEAASTLLGIFDQGQGVTTDLRFQKGQMYWGPINLGNQTSLF